MIVCLGTSRKRASSILHPIFHFLLIPSRFRRIFAGIRKFLPELNCFASVDVPGKRKAFKNHPKVCFRYARMLRLEI